MRIFRDKTSLSANPSLWRSIEQALTESQFCLLLASPASAKSPWVKQEIQWWLRHRSVEKLLIGLTDGDILWDGQTGDFDWGKTTAIPYCLKGAFAAEPLYADFRPAKASGRFLDSDPAYRSALLDVAAPLTGRPKDDLDSEDIRLHRKARRTVGAVAVVTVVLAGTAGVGLNMSYQRQKTATSRALASEATSHVDDRSLALLLSIEARRIADTVEARRSLLTGLQRLPNAEAFLWGHTNAVTRAIFSPDGRTVLSAGWDDRIILWSVSTRQPIGQPVEGPKGLVGVAFNPDGSQFASSARASVVIWDTGSRKPVGAPFTTDMKEEFEKVAFSSTGKMLAASTAAFGGHPATVVIWDVATRERIGQPVEGSSFAFSPDDTLLAIARYKELVLYDIRSHRLAFLPRDGHFENITSVAFSPDGTTVATGSSDKTIALWDLASHSRLGTLRGHSAAVTRLLFNPQGSILLSGSDDGAIKRWNVEDLKVIDTPVESSGAAISSIFFSPDGHARSLALEKNRVVVINIDDDPPLGRRVGASDVGSSNLAFSPDGRFLASSGEFGGVLEWEVDRGKLNGMPLSGHDRAVSSLAYAPDGKVLLSGSEDGTVIFWDMDKREPLGPPIKAHRSPVWSMACSPDGKTVVSGADAQLVFWDLATRRPRGSPVSSQKDRIWGLTFSPDGKFMASVGNDRVVQIWKAGDPTQPVKTFGTSTVGHYEWMTPAGVRFNPDGTLLAMSTREDSVALWNVRTGQAVPPALYGHTKSISSVDFRRDGKVLASGSEDGDIRLWDVETHELLGTLSAKQKAIKSVVFSPRNDVLASVGEDDSIVFWEGGFEGWSGRACRIANRNLTLQEWATYFGKLPYRKTCPDL
jgi:WD40 repeat protein